MVAMMTALQKPDGGVCGVATSTTFRRFVVKTLARQFGKAVVATYAPFQFALSTRAGTDCVGHAIHYRAATVLSIDGIGAYDHVHRSAMVAKLLEVPSLRGLVPFVRSTNTRPTSYTWIESDGTQHRMRDPLMLALQLGNPRRFEGSGFTIGSKRDSVCISGRRLRGHIS